MKVILDTNVLLVALPSHSPYRPIWDAVLDGRITLFATTEILMEYQEIIAQRATPQSAILLNEFLTELDAVSNRTIYYRWNLIASDPDDNKFVDACIEGNADYLVTADHHFDMLAEIPFPKVNVISPKEFLTLLKNHTS